MMTEEELSNSVGIQSKRWHLLSNNQGQESEEEESNAMAALMRSTNKEIETNCKLVRDVTESQREQKRETVPMFEKLLESGKE